MEIEAEVKEVPKRFIRHSLLYGRFVSWSEIEREQTQNLNGSKRIIILVIGKKPLKKTADNMYREVKMKWQTISVDKDMFRWLKLKHHHRKDADIPPEPFRIIFDEEFIFD